MDPTLSQRPLFTVCVYHHSIELQPYGSFPHTPVILHVDSLLRKYLIQRSNCFLSNCGNIELQTPNF